ncbi:hypothetical protein [Deinococcus sp. QL22]|uniref:hypothetical protein n=1 Tax=Deinococcus sp. QL22 TaxID=2939437 RepID=UPI002017D752|nr:hypothetical protein [Deinococcus sp. QL22]UQN06755.1 hypothetical protein M1R55_02200 [Deinococcus sp. QL22]
MTFTRPAPGAPFDKRITAQLLEQLLAAGPRAFNADIDVDLFDAIEEAVASHLAQFTGNGAAVAGLFYAANSLDAVVTPSTLKVSSFASLGQAVPAGPLTVTVGQTFPVFPAEIAGTSGPYPQSGPVKMLTGGVVTFPLTLGIPGAAGTLSLTWYAADRGFFGIGLFPPSPTRYTVELLSGAGAVLQTWADVIPSASPVTRQTDYGVNSFMPQTHKTAHAVNAALSAGAYSLRITALEVFARIAPESVVGGVDANTYPALFRNAGLAVVDVLSAAPVDGGVTVPANPQGGTLPATLPEVSLTLTAPALPVHSFAGGVLGGDALAVIPNALGPSTAEQIAAIEFTLHPDPDSERAGWGAQFGFSLALLADDLLHHDLKRMVEGVVLTYRRPTGSDVFGGVLRYGVRYRAECRALIPLQDDINLTVQFYNATTGVALGVGEVQPLTVETDGEYRPYHLSGQNATLPPASLRVALLTLPPSGSRHGYPARVEVHSWREARL